MIRSVILSTVLLLCPIIASGQDMKVIQGATLFDGTGRAPLKDAIIVIEGSRIKQVGTKGKVNVPSGAEVIDARGKFVIPGLSDMHNHLDSDSIGITQHAQDFKRSLKRMLGWGFTIIFDPASRDLSSLPELKRISGPDTAPTLTTLELDVPLGRRMVMDLKASTYPKPRKRLGRQCGK